MSETPKTSLAQLPVTLRDIEAAAGVLEGFVKRTSFERSRTLSEISGASVWLKFENLQCGGDWCTLNPSFRRLLSLKQLNLVGIFVFNQV